MLCINTTCVFIEPLGSSDHNQIHFNIKVKTGSTYKNNGGGTSTKANIK